jgi:hypothetical protein
MLPALAAPEVDEEAAAVLVEELPALEEVVMVRLGVWMVVVFV